MNDKTKSDQDYAPASFAWLCGVLILVIWLLSFFSFDIACFYFAFYVFGVSVVCIQLVRGWTWDEAWFESISRNSRPVVYWLSIAVECMLIAFVFLKALETI